jgi:hypothetical protein
MSIIGMAIKAAAAEPPHNPFSLNNDVNQPDTSPPPPPPRQDQ